jgi:ATP-dependent Lon protease
VVQLLRLPDGTVKVLVEGKKRARIVSTSRHATTSSCRPKRSKSPARRPPRSKR